MNLFIDTSNNLQTLLKLDKQNFIKQYSSPRDQDVIGALTEFLHLKNITLADLTSIEVNLGPGSFTGLRVGVSIANALSLALNIPINHQPPGTVLVPQYGQPPSITKSPKNTTYNRLDKK